MRQSSRIGVAGAAALSLLSTVTASWAMSVVYLTVNGIVFRPATDGLLGAPLILTLVAATSTLIAIPAGLVVGTPLVFVLQDRIRRTPVVTTSLLAALGSGLAYLVDRLADSSGIQHGTMLPWYLAWR